jgi:hypothetical protein
MNSSSRKYSKDKWVDLYPSEDNIERFYKYNVKDADYNASMNLIICSVALVPYFLIELI